MQKGQRKELIVWAGFKMQVAVSVFLFLCVCLCVCLRVSEKWFAHCQ